MVSELCVIFSSNRSFLLRKRMMDVSVNHLLLQMLSNSFMLSCIRFWGQDIEADNSHYVPPTPTPTSTFLSASYHLLILGQDQVIGAQGYTEDDGCDTLEAVDPFLPLRPLTTHIKHPADIGSS
jgi:hypothetical protein